MSGRAPVSEVWLRAVPALFVVLWSTGFLGAKLGLPYAEPFTFLGIRMVIAAALLLAFALASGAPWPVRPRDVGHQAVAGVLIHGIYLGGVFSAIDGGMSPAVAALIVGLQPLLTAALAGWWLRERVTRRQWVGLVLGFAGVALVVGDGPGETVQLAGVVAVFAALIAITVGTLYQKRFCGGADLRTSGVIQYAATACLMLLLAGLFETRQVQWTGPLVFALAWLVLALSVGAVGLLYTLIRRGAASRVASLFYLVPPFTAVFAFLLFGDRLGARAMVGMGVVVLAVWLVNARTGR